jgi:hypothetical protein
LPGYVEKAGVSANFFGKVVGNLPEGLTSPKRTSAKEFPNSCPGNQHCKIALDWSTQGISQGAPVLRTTTEFLFISQILVTNSS